MGMFNVDMQDTTSMRVLSLSVTQLLSAIDDTTMVSGGEAYNASLIFYNAVKQAAKQNIPGAKDIYNELKKRYPGRPVQITEE